MSPMSSVIPLVAVGSVVIVLIVLCLVLLLKPKKKKQPQRAPQAPIPFSSRRTALPDVLPVADQPTAPQAVVRPSPSVRLSAPAVPMPPKTPPPPVPPTTPSRVPGSVPIRRVAPPSEPLWETFDEDDEEDRALSRTMRDLHDSQVHLRAYKERLQRPRPEAPHLVPQRPVPSASTSAVTYYPFADETEMTEARENSTVLHTPRAVAKKLHFESRNHGNHPRKRTNRGGGNHRRFESGIQDAG